MTSDGKKVTLLSGILTKIATLLSPKKNQTLAKNDLYPTTFDPLHDYYATGNMNSIYTNGLGSGTNSLQNVYNVITTTAPAATTGLYNTYGWNASSSTSYGFNPYEDSDLVIKRRGKPELKIAATLDLILESLYIIVPDNKELENNPALKSAYEHWQETFQEHSKRMLPIKEAYDGYIMMQKLVQETEE